MGTGKKKTGEPLLKEPKMGLLRFLQIEEQPSGIKTILTIKHKAEVHTENEWENIVSDLLSKKI